LLGVVRRPVLVRAALGAMAVAVGCAAGCSPDPPSPGSATAAVQRASARVVVRWGSFFGGRRGNFGTDMRPEIVTLPGPVAEVGTSNSTQYALLADGSLFAWGLGTQGQLGDGTTRNSVSTPVRVRFPAGVKIASIPTDAMPYDTGLAVDTEGRVWGWGDNGGGELCLGNRRARRVPVLLPLSQVTAVAGASNHALYDAGGTVYACGQNVAGDLGDGSRRGSTVPVQVPGLGGGRVTELVASFANSGALLAGGAYFDWGYDGHGQLGDGYPDRSSDVPVRVALRHPVKQVAQGGSLWDNGQTLVILSDGSLWAWGDDWAGQLGNGGASGMQEPSPVRFRSPAGVTYRSLATGSATSYAVSTTGAVYAWGASHVGQVGDGLTITVRTPALVTLSATSISATANNVVINTPDKDP
jgi:alpha-tubulin suppressor-like RCC1 family protein